MKTAVEGLPELDRVFKELKRSVANKVARPAINKGASLAAKAIKSAVPSRLKGIRKVIGWRPLKTKHNQGVVGAKIGAAVGKRKKKTVGKTVDRTGKKGVGIGARNVHWWFLGTKDRKLKKGSLRGPKAGHPTGKMIAQMPGVSAIVNAQRGAMVQFMRVKMQQSLEKEVNRVRKR